jgi:hypothetical protein
MQSETKFVRVKEILSIELEDQVRVSGFNNEHKEAIYGELLKQDF